ncbi:hypothetical protein FPV67DRAFT_1668096 [Lyophyllum atratum]|nr:hypothetical protein FPV67DRAFT_1668096 [Lyophyllum atratum]
MSHSDWDAAAATWRYQTSSKPQPPLPLSPPSLASAGRQKPTHRSHASAPRAGLGLADVDTLSPISPRGLGAPFNHRTTRSQPAVRVPPQHQEQPMPKSFIDITPEQEIRHEASRTRMRKLLARASIGFIGWGKSLTKKKTISK